MKALTIFLFIIGMGLLISGYVALFAVFASTIFYNIDLLFFVVMFIAIAFLAKLLHFFWEKFMEIIK